VLDIDGKWYESAGLYVQRATERYFGGRGACNAEDKVGNGVCSRVVGDCAGTRVVGDCVRTEVVGDGMSSGVQGDTLTGESLPFAQLHWHVCDVTEPLQDVYPTLRAVTKLDGDCDAAATAATAPRTAASLEEPREADANELRDTDDIGRAARTAKTTLAAAVSHDASALHTDADRPARTSDTAASPSAPQEGSALHAAGVALIITSYLFTIHPGLPDGHTGRLAPHTDAVTVGGELEVRFALVTILYTVRLFAFAFAF